MILSGYFGADNTGDELILRSLVEAIDVRAPGIDVAVAAERPDRVEALHRTAAFPRADDKAAAQIVGNQPLPPGVSTADAAAWIGVARALINLDEFITRD